MADATRLVVKGISVSTGSGPLAPLALRLDAPVVVLYGRNGTGKTRLLDALRHAAGDPSVGDGPTRAVRTGPAASSSSGT